MDLLSVIRRWRLRDEIPLREIERRTDLSRNTIRKYLRADTVVPEFKVPDRSSKLDPFAEKLTGWLQIEAGKSRKQKRTATHVLNILHRLIDGKAPPAAPIDAPQALRLAQEPLANVGRYDALREGGLRHAS